MCFAPPTVTAGPTPDQGAIATQQAYNAAREQRKTGYGSDDTDIIGKLISKRPVNDNQGPTVQLKKLMGL